MKRSQVFQLLFFTTARLIFNTMHRMMYPFLAVFARGMGVDVQQVSWALTLRAGIGGLGPFLATISDSRGRKTGMVTGMVLFILGLGLVIWQPVFWGFVSALMLTSAGFLTFIPSLQAYMGDSFPYHQRGLAMALVEMGWSLSFIVGVPLMGLLMARYGWRSPFPVLLGFALVYLLLLLKIVPGGRPAAGSVVPPWVNLRRVFTSPVALSALAMSAALTGANEMVNLAIGLWMEDSFAFQVTSLGALAIGIGLAELLGEGLVGAFVDRAGKLRAVAVGLFANIASALFLIFLSRSLAGAFIGLLLFYLTFEFTVVSSLPLMTEVLPVARASLMAANMALVSLSRAAGASIAAVLYARHTFPEFFSGISTNALASVALNILALLALFVLQKGMKHAR